ncbi:hypothetical protein BD309DRAFT_861308 [Dichomitus squalens]|uniref:DUF6533 domain-containing protein n=1 Tax=Dichomitus squalens TaxID=114155 RepID=A0A4Q9PKX7_9APHY|nr:hypothetical protein BD311DRAFT_777995 [Dichomitus squalens]TBU44900.1 hypothetical protein BD309DRAFT_861308 [Dichomitus squalens]TBU54792.1 hypothetical protein BD310DRAFT_827233 [Dichomitus squalens]
MSSATIDGLTVPQYSEYLTATRIQVAVVCLFVYEYIITFGYEAKYFWGRKINGAAILLYLNRYISLLLYLLDMLSAITLSDEETIVLQDTSIVTELTEPMTTILISRFLFHLQAADRASLDMDSSDSHEGLPETSSRTNISSVVFDRIVGSLSADIAPEDLLGTADEDSEDYAEKSDFVGTTQTEYLEEPVEKGKSVNEMQEVNALDFGTRASSNTLRGLDTVEEVV